MSNSITIFDDEYLFLSNFYERELNFKGMRFKNSEAAYQSQKDPNREKEFIELTPKESKRLGRKVEIRKDWDEIKDVIMEVVVREKFHQNKDLAKKLMDTGNSTLVEGNYWKDTYWGVCDNVGENKLGKILMKTRNELNLTSPTKTKEE